MSTVLPLAKAASNTQMMFHHDVVIAKVFAARFATLAAQQQQIRLPRNMGNSL